LKGSRATAYFRTSPGGTLPRPQDPDSQVRHVFEPTTASRRQVHVHEQRRL
jgi:hypothetical protein